MMKNVFGFDLKFRIIFLIVINLQSVRVRYIKVRCGPLAFEGLVTTRSRNAVQRTPDYGVHIS
jgi:hypothetical protein